MRSGIQNGRSGLAGVLILLVCLSASLRLDVAAQIRPVYDQGALGLGRLLKRLNTSASAMMIGAHPDDEDTALLAYLARGENARTAYLSLTRGDGGQNIIGPELGEALGVIRTEELLQARKLDGAEQYFTRAYDYGFSKTLAEAKQKWDEKIVLCDAVRVIRQFRPLVVISQFSGTPADGHGQHQFSGYIAPLAVKAAADPEQCKEDGSVWQVKKFYVRHRGQGEPTLRINTGKYDPMLGRSYFEIAMEARSQHRSQEQGVLELKGEQYSSLNLAESKVPRTEKEQGIFDGIDTSWTGAPSVFGDEEPATEYTKQQLTIIQRSSERALEEFDPREPRKTLPFLIERSKAMIDLVRGKAAGKPADPDEEGEAIDFDDTNLNWAIIGNLREVNEAAKRAAGVQIDALANQETASVGEQFPVAVRVFFPAGSGVKIKDIKLLSSRCLNHYDPRCAEIEISKADEPKQVPNSFRREVANAAWYYNVKVRDAAQPTQPYWLQKNRDSDLFRWDLYGTGDRGMPFQAPALWVSVKAEIDGTGFTFSQFVEYRYADDIRGEIRRPLAVVPPATVALDQELMIVARNSKPVRKTIVATVTNHSPGPISGKIDLKLPERWTAAAGDHQFSLTKKGESSSVQFSVTIPANAAAGSYSLGAAAGVGTSVYSKAMRTIAYPHIQTHRTYSDAAAKANVIDLKTSPARIGYIPGSGDRVPQAIAQMGLAVETIDERTLASGDLSQFDVIVVGIRAYQVRTDIVAHNKRLLDFANAGGTLIVQYQLPGYTQQNLAPFPAQQGPRVSDEFAKVTMVDPAHPLLNAPNKISEANFEGWVQERNLYNFSTMDPKYTGLLEAHDANEPENRGGLVVADVGKGKYIYCSYSLFRQLPAGVPGAYRLLANMLAYSGSSTRAGRK